MDAALETLEGLKRKLTVTVSAQTITEEVANRVKNLVRKVKIDGYRPGKAPLEIVKRRFYQSVLDEVSREKAQDAFGNAIQEHDLKLAGYPVFQPLNIQAEQDLLVSAEFEVYPEIVITSLENETIEQITAEVTDADVDALIEKMLERDQTWEKVERPVEHGDKVLINFKGFVDGVAFEGGEAQDFELQIGSGSMIPGFEDQIIGVSLQEERDITVTFPQDYHAKDLAGKEAVFKITVTEIKSGQKPVLDEAYAKKYVAEGDVAAFKKEIRENMQKQLQNQLNTRNKEAIFDKMLARNHFDLPSALVDQEIENLKHEFYHRIYGHEHHDNEKIPDFPREMFEARAQRRVHLGLLFSEYVVQNEMKIEQDKVEAFIERHVAVYENPEEMRRYILNHKERMREIEALVLEEMTVDKMKEAAVITEKMLSYADVMNPQHESDLKDE